MFETWQWAKMTWVIWWLSCRWSPTFCLREFWNLSRLVCRRWSIKGVFSKIWPKHVCPFIPSVEMYRCLSQNAHVVSHYATVTGIPYWNSNFLSYSTLFRHSIKKAFSSDKICPHRHVIALENYISGLQRSTGSHVFLGPPLLCGEFTL